MTNVAACNLSNNNKDDNYKQEEMFEDKEKSSIPLLLIDS